MLRVFAQDLLQKSKIVHSVRGVQMECRDKRCSKETCEIFS